MPSLNPLPAILRRWNRATALRRLAREAGWRHLVSLGVLSSLSSVLEITGLGIGVSVLLGTGTGSKLRLPFPLSLEQGLIVLILLMLLRGGLQALVAIGQERLRSGFTDRLRQQLLSLVLHASSRQLARVGRGELLGLLMANISRSVLALDQGVRTLQALLALLLYATGVLVVGQAAAVPLLLALAATGAAALLQRSGSWQLGRLQTHLNGALQRTVGDGLHGLKAVRAAAAETWLLNRFADDNQRFRRVLRQSVQRQALFGSLRDCLVVVVVGVWLIWSRSDLQPAVVATTLLLAYRTAGSLSAVINAQRLCLGALPGYEELCKRRLLLVPGQSDPLPTAMAPQQLEATSTPLRALCWCSTDPERAEEMVELSTGRLVAVVGPSGCGKTTRLDRVCGLLDEEASRWTLQTATEQRQLNGADGARLLRRHIAYAPQDAVLFEASLRHNLCFDQVVSPSTLEAWFERLGLSHLLRRREGLEEPLALAMDPFSGGEIHRLGLLRAWLRDQPVEVLDEPTAFLDEQAAQAVRSILLERVQHKLVLVSTHDPELMRLADQIIHLPVQEKELAVDCRVHHRGASQA